MLDVQKAQRAEYIGHELEARIRERVRSRRWYRREGRFLHWRDDERANTLALRELFAIRRSGIREWRAEERRIEAAWRRSIDDLAAIQAADPDYPAIAAMARDEMAGWDENMKAAVMGR